MIYAKKLSEFKEITHGFTTREEKDYQIWLTQNSAVAKNCVRANQVHGNDIKQVKNGDKNKIIKKTDGLITKNKNIFLGIKTADCLPILFYEPEAKIVAAVHAGWRGTSQEIAGKMVDKILEMGGIGENIICVIGPHICEKCYDVLEDRAKLFDKSVVNKLGGKFYLDLGLINIKQLLEQGILEKNIELMPYCTFHQNEMFFSYRKNKDKNYGEMLAFIGMIN